MEKSKSPSQSKTEHMFALVTKYKKSNLTQKEFCEKEKISVGVLQYWMKKKRAQIELRENSGFHPLYVNPSKSGTGLKDRIMIIRTASGITKIGRASCREIAELSWRDVW